MKTDIMKWGVYLMAMYIAAGTYWKCCGSLESPRFNSTLFLFVVMPVAFTAGAIVAMFDNWLDERESKRG